jgi:hypothetical protein
MLGRENHKSQARAGLRLEGKLVTSSRLTAVETN